MRGRLERGGYWRRYESRTGFQGRGPKGYQRSDDRIREEICDCMTDDPVLDASEIEVVVEQGEVTLTGSVESRDQKRRAEDVAESVSGVRDVTNQLRVSRNSASESTA
ncbi:MAG TPA: BON domain-containing protein [Vicinamibacterales bacterium]|nr:BON domain-containing protein [Vicinamibacterales bacterium]